MKKIIIPLSILMFFKHFKVYSAFVLLVFISLFACKSAENSKSLNLKGQKFSYTTDVSYINTKVCEFSCECDCGIGDFIFNDNETCYFSDFCCCGNPRTFYAGEYRITSTEVICAFKSTYVSEYDEATTNMNAEDISPINPIPLVKEGKAFTYRFKIGYCPDGQLYLYDEHQDKTYLKLKGLIKPEEIRFDTAVDMLLNSYN
jgi:hypothetical protein